MTTNPSRGLGGGPFRQITEQLNLLQATRLGSVAADATRISRMLDAVRVSPVSDLARMLEANPLPSKSVWASLIGVEDRLAGLNRMQLLGLNDSLKLLDVGAGLSRLLEGAAGTWASWASEWEEPQADEVVQAAELVQVRVAEGVPFSAIAAYLSLVVSVAAFLYTVYVQGQGLTEEQVEEILGEQLTPLVETLDRVEALLDEAALSLPGEETDD